MISNLLSFTAFLHGVLVSYGAFVCLLLKDCPPLFATKAIHGIMVPSFFCISNVFVWQCVWPLYLCLSLSLSSSLPPSFSLWFHDTCHLMLFTQYSLLDQFYFCTSCLSIAHLKFTNNIHQLFTDYLLRLPYSELLETHLFRSRANRRLVILWTWQHPKRSNSGRLLQFLNLTTSKTKQFCETSFKNGKLSAALTASYQCVLRFFYFTCLKYCACREKSS